VYCPVASLDGSVLFVCHFYVKAGKLCWLTVFLLPGTTSLSNSFCLGGGARVGFERLNKLKPDHQK